MVIEVFVGVALALLTRDVLLWFVGTRFRPRSHLLRFSREAFSMKTRRRLVRVIGGP